MHKIALYFMFIHRENALKAYQHISYCSIQARQTRPNSGGVAEPGHPRFDKGGGGVAIFFYFLRVKNRTF